MVPFVVIIPARLASSRLPNKPLADIHGKPMVIRVAEQAIASGAQEVIIATDDHRIYEVALAHQIKPVMTSTEHQSGTDRLAETVEQLHYADETIIVNVQGDEPLIDPQLIQKLAYHLNEHPQSAIATIATPITQIEDVFNPNIVKVVMDSQHQALYFSRASIPWDREHYSKNQSAQKISHYAYRHIGLYAYRASFLKQYSQLPPSPLEQIESLEQLRALWHGKKISVYICANSPAHGVDTPDDLDQIRRIFSKQQK